MKCWKGGVLGKKGDKNERLKVGENVYGWNDLG